MSRIVQNVYELDENMEIFGKALQRERCAGLAAPLPIPYSLIRVLLENKR